MGPAGGIITAAAELPTADGGNVQAALDGHASQLAEIANNVSAVGQTVTIKRERDIIQTLFKYGQNYDYVHDAGSTSASPEGISMFYHFDKTIPISQREDMANRLAYWCDKAKDDIGKPICYTFNVQTGVIANEVNSQHAFWAAKMFFEHYKFTKDSKWLTRSKEIADWVIANMVNGTSTNRCISRYYNTPDQISIKTMSSADVLLNIGIELNDSSYKTLYDENLNWLNTHNKINIGNYLYAADISYANPAPVVNDIAAHETCEFVDGLLDAFDITGDVAYYDLARNIFNDVTNMYYSLTGNGTIYLMPCFQMSYIAKKLNMPDFSERTARKALSLRNSDGGFHPQIDAAASNIFPHTYLMAYLHAINHGINIAEIPSPILSTNFSIGSITDAGETFTMSGAENTDYKLSALGIEFLSDSGGALINLPNSFDFNDFAFITSFIFNDVVDTNNNVIFLIRDSTNPTNDAYLIKNTNKTFSFFVRKNNTGIMFPATTAMTAIAKGTKFIIGGIRKHGLVQMGILTGNNIKYGTQSATAVVSDAMITPQLTIGRLVTTLSSKSIIQKVSIFSPAPTAEQLIQMMICLKIK